MENEVDAEVEVFDFTYYHAMSGSFVLRTGTLKRIAAVQATPIPGSGRWVPASFVTFEGAFRPPEIDG